MPIHKRPRPRLRDLLAEREVKLNWEKLEAADLSEWDMLTDAEHRELLRRAHEGELSR